MHLSIVKKPTIYERICSLLNIKYACGDDRVVLIIEFLGLVIKFPKTKKGSRVNFGEWYFWKKNRHPFCQPAICCFSLRGFKQRRQWIVIQRLGHRPCACDPEEFKIKCSILTRRVSETDDHHFSATNNFFFNKKNKLVMVDYGDRQTRRVIKACGHKIHNDFDEHQRCTFDDLIRLIEVLEGIRLYHEPHHH